MGDENESVQLGFNGVDAKLSRLLAGLVEFYVREEMKKGVEFQLMVVNSIRSVM